MTAQPFRLFLILTDPSLAQEVLVAVLHPLYEDDEGEDVVIVEPTYLPSTNRVHFVHDVRIAPMQKLLDRMVLRQIKEAGSLSQDDLSHIRDALSRSPETSRSVKIWLSQYTS